jgi:uncharacterized membrane protein
MSELIVITYDTEKAGYDALDEVIKLQNMELITLEDAAVVVMNQKGKVKIKQTLEKQITGSAAAWGFFWGLLIGLLFLFPLAWGLFGALMGGIFGKATDVGIDNKFMKEVGDSLEPGMSALFMLVIKATEDKVIEDMAEMGGHLYQTSLSKEDEEKLRKALEHEDIRGAASEAMDLEEAGEDEVEA